MPRQRPPAGTLPAVLGALLQQQRIQRGLTLSDLGELAGCSAAVIRRYEFGDRYPSWPAFIRIARALDTTPSMLMSHFDGFDLEDDLTLKKKKRSRAA